MEVFPVDWKITEHELTFEITCYGKLSDGRSVCMHIPFTPYFFVECPPAWHPSRAKIFVAECIDKLGAMAKFSLPVLRKTIWGFTNCEQRTFVQLAFSTLAGARKARRVVTERYKMKTYEATVDQILRLFHVRSIKPAQWITVQRWAEVEEEDRAAVTDLEISVVFTDLHPSETQTVPPLVFASWDIECYSESGGFPMASNQSDVICTICTTFHRYGEQEPYLNHCVTLHGCDQVPGMTIESFDTEADVINAWIDMLRDQSVDVLLGWNTYGFDYKYVYGRSLVCVDDTTAAPLVFLHNLGKAVEGGGVPVQKTLSSAAYGDNNYFYLSAPGVLHLDVMQLIKREHKFESYSLNFVSKQILGDSKIDLKPAEIFAKFRGSDADRAVVAEYCAKDVLLPLKLVIGKLAIFQNCVEMANATSVPIEYLITRGQTIKVFSLILQKARALGFVCPDIDRSPDNAPTEKYEGATVLNAEKGAYLSDIVSALDFASLYPSIIRAHRMCPSTLVRDPRYDTLPGVEYYTVETPRGTYKFAQVENAVLPALLDDLALYRKAAKKRMAEAKAAGDTFAESVENGRQLAYKVCMNSAYGFFGASKGFLPCVEIAASVTATGREMIAKTKALVETLNEGGRVIYGDSVAGYTPIYIRHPTGAVELTTFHRLADLFRMPFLRSPCGKQYLPIPPGVDIWSDNGWTPFVRAIRHRVSKKMVRVVTRTGIVDCTLDHSLLRPTGKAVRPTEVRAGETLMHTDVPCCLSVGKFEGRQGDWHLQAAAQFASMERPVVRVQQWGEWILAEANSSEEMHNPDEILEVYELSDLTMLSAPYEPFVYDATTANHHFAAGIGRLVVHNTDSVLCILNCGEENRTNMHKHFEVAQHIADTITKEFKAPNELEFEKTYYPYLLFTKKRYAGMMFTEPNAPAYMDIKGLQLVRRDNCQLVKAVSNDILETIMRDKSASLAVAAAKKHILALLNNQNPMESYITSKSLKSDYKNPESQPHCQVALKIHQRRGYPVSSGERVPYIFIEDLDKPDGLQAQRAEDPAYAEEHGLIVDRLHYLDSQISGPVETLLDVLQPGTYANLVNSPEIKPLLDELRKVKNASITVAKRVRKNTQNKQHEITNFFSRS